MIQNNSIEFEISEIKSLPPLPETSIRIISAVNDAEILVDDLVKVLIQSPVLVARILGMANSSFFGRSGQIVDLKTAIVQVLGLNLVKSLTLSIVLTASLKTVKCENFDSTYFWNHALITAIVAQNLAKIINEESLTPQNAYTSGLLLNIGLLAVIYKRPEELNEIFSKVDKIHGSVKAEMYNVFGKDQYEIGLVLLQSWKLPIVFQEVVKYFRSSPPDDCEKLVLLVELSHWVASYIISDRMDESPKYSDLLNKLSISSTLFDQVVGDVVTSKDNILELASVISE